MTQMTRVEQCKEQTETTCLTSFNECSHRAAQPGNVPAWYKGISPSDLNSGFEPNPLADTGKSVLSLAKAEFKVSESRYFICSSKVINFPFLALI